MLSRSSLLSHLRHRLQPGDERGSVLIELLVAIPAALAVGGAAMVLTGVFARSEQVTAGRSSDIQNGQVALDRVTRELRQARTAAVSADGRVLTLTTAAGAPVAYDCTGTRCRRLAPPTASAGPVVVEGIEPAGRIFTVTGSNYVEVKLSTSTSVVTDGAELVNQGLEP